MQHIKNYINGHLVEPVSKNISWTTITPATGKVYSYIPDSDEKGCWVGVCCCKGSLPIMECNAQGIAFKNTSSAFQRSSKNLDRLALAESIDNGKPLKPRQNRWYPGGCSQFSFYGTAFLHYAAHARYGGNSHQLHPAPTCRCGRLHFAPNLPWYLFSWK